MSLFHTLQIVNLPAPVVSVADAADFLRVDDQSEYASIEGLIEVGMEEVCRVTGQAFGTATYVARFTKWPTADSMPLKLFEEVSPNGFLQLPRWPVLTVEHVKHYVDGTQVTLAPSDWRIAEQGILPVTEWPTNTDVRPDAIEVRFTAGQTFIPQSIRQAVLLLCRFHYAGGNPNNYSDQQSDYDKAHALLSNYRTTFL